MNRPSSDGGSGQSHVRIFLASFLILFLQVALIRWMPAYVRLLAYFSNFILLACFLGIGVGCLLAGSAARTSPGRRGRLFVYFPALQCVVVAAVYFFRLEVGVGTEGAIYFSSGTSDDVTRIETTWLLPLIFVIVAALFATLAERMADEMSVVPPLPAYTTNLSGSLIGVGAFALLSWLELSPTVWFGVAFAAAVPLVSTAAASGERRPPTLLIAANVALLVVSIGLVEALARGSLWSPYYRITVSERGEDTAIEVNNVFHQSMAPLDHKEYFYEWPYQVAPGGFENVLVLGAGSGTDVAAALRNGAGHVDAVEIDPTILRLGRQRHPDRPYSDPRVTLINDDARHFLRTSDKKYDLVVFALIDSLTLQSSFSGVRLESYMFTEESFRAVRERLAPNGLLVIYNYFREPWLVDRLANTAAAAFGEEPRVHVHQARGYLGVLLAGPRLASLSRDLPVPDRVAMYGMKPRSTPAHLHQRNPAIEAARDDWPFLYLRDRHVPRHYVAAVALILAVSVAAVVPIVRRRSGLDDRHARGWSWRFFLLGAGFMLLETKSIIQFALLWGSTWVVASLAIASVLVMALAANFVVARREVARPGRVLAALVALLALNYALPVGRLAFDSRPLESFVYAALMFSPIFCAGLLFGSAIKRSTNLPRDYGVNLLGAMVGGTAEYLSLVTGFQPLLVLIAACYVGAVIAWRPAERALPEM
jgi:SAM-dependent methyltransferase